MPGPAVCGRVAVNEPWYYSAFAPDHASEEMFEAAKRMHKKSRQGGVFVVVRCAGALHSLGLWISAPQMDRVRLESL